MRMSEEDIFIIKSTILKYIQNAKIILFGNRINDNKKGGDIDILIQTDENVSLKQELRIANYRSKFLWTVQTAMKK